MGGGVRGVLTGRGGGYQWGLTTDIIIPRPYPAIPDFGYMPIAKLYMSFVRKNRGVIGARDIPVAQ